MKRIMQALLCLSLSTCAFGQMVTVLGNQIIDSTGALVSNATITFSPVLSNGNPASYRRGSGGGQAIVTPVSAPVSSGAFSLALVDSAQTSPTNICYAVIVSDNITGSSILGPGYSCVQPTSFNSWCSGGNCDFDGYQPNLKPIALTQTGPAGPIGPPGLPGPVGTPVSGALLNAGDTLTSALLATVCNGSAGGLAILPSGPVNLAATLIVPAHCTIQGQGIGVSTILVAPNTVFTPGMVVNTQHALTLPATLDQDITLRDFTLDGNLANNPTASWGIVMGNLSNLSIDHVEVNGGMVHLGGTVAGYDASYTNHISITNSYFHDAGVAHGDDQDTLQVDAQYVNVSNNTLGPSTDTGTALLGGSATQQTAHVAITGNNYVNNAQDCGVAEGDPTQGDNPSIVVQSWDVTITGNLMSCTGGHPYGIFFNQSHKITITGNTIHLAPAAGGSASAAAIYLGAVSDATVTGNQIDGATTDGIWVDGINQDSVSGVTLTGNVIRNPNRYGVHLSSEVQATGTKFESITVTGNTVIDPGNGTAQPGMVVSQDSGSSSFNNVTIVGNNIIDDLPTHLMTYGLAYIGFPTGMTIGLNNISGFTTAAYSTPNAGGEVMAHVEGNLNTSTNTVSGANTDTQVTAFASLPGGSFSDIQQLHDILYYFDINNVTDTGGLTIASHSTTHHTTGIRIDGANDVLELWGGKFKIEGTIAYTGQKTAGTCVFSVTNGMITSITGC